jgi:putative aminopeptidase FrvX
MLWLGTYGTFATRYRRRGRIVTGKAFDDRIGCAALVELLQGEPFDFDLHVAFTVQEEVGLRGASVAAYAIEPDCAFVLEGTICHDLPAEKDVSPTTRLGQGPALTVMDRRMHACRSMLDHVMATARELNIPYQFKQPGVGGTDAGAVMRSRQGVPSLSVSVPCRYIHSPIGLASLTDLRQTVHLMRESLTRLAPDVVVP